MKWQKFTWPLPPDIQPQSGQMAVQYYGDEQYTLVYWDETLKDFRFAGDVAHIYGGREPSHIVLIEPPVSGE